MVKVSEYERVKWAKLHSTIFIPGVGNLKDTLPPDNKTLPEFAMTRLINGDIVLSWKDIRSGSIERYVLGAASVLAAMLDAVKPEVIKKPATS